MKKGGFRVSFFSYIDTLCVIARHEAIQETRLEKDVDATSKETSLKGKWNH